MQTHRYHYEQHHHYVYDPNDGRPANWLRICKCCKAKIPGGAQFCRHCGTPTRRPHTERYRNRVALQALALMFAIMLIANWLIPDPILKMSFAGFIIVASLTVLVSRFRRNK